MYSQRWRHEFCKGERIKKFIERILDTDRPGLGGGEISILQFHFKECQKCFKAGMKELEKFFLIYIQYKLPQTPVCSTNDQLVRYVCGEFLSKTEKKKIETHFKQCNFCETDAYLIKECLKSNK